MQAGIDDACAVLQIIKQIEPEEMYVKGSSMEAMDYPHWHSENYWLQG